MKTSQSHSHGSANSSERNLKLKNGNSSSKKNDTISKYFSTNSKKNCEETSIKSENSDELDSPYKKSLSEIKYSPSDDDFRRDFRTPKPIKVQKKSVNKKSNLNKQSKVKSKSNVSRNRSTTKQYSLFKATQDNFGLSDVNPDHLQMALALSKSTYVAEYPQSSNNVEEIFPTFLSPDKIPKWKTTLERYGFKSAKPVLESELKQEHVEVTKKGKNSKFRFVTPILKTRTTEERQSIIATKVSMVLCSNNVSVEDSQEFEDEYELCSDLLKKLKVSSSSLFSVNGLCLKESYYYSIKLGIPPTNTKCGCLLKKWENIPGREKSPVREQSKFYQKNSDLPTVSSTTSEKIDCMDDDNNADLNYNNSDSTSLTKNLFVEFSANRDCISPDLFESDTETDFILKSPEIADEISQSLLSPSKRRQTDLERNNFQGHKISQGISKAAVVSDEVVYYSDNEEMFEILTQDKEDGVRSKQKCQDVLQHSEDEDTEQLYLSSLRSKDEFVDLTQSSSSDTHMGDGTKQVDNKNIEQFKNFEDIVDLLTSSSNDSTGHCINKISEKLNKNQSSIYKSNNEINSNTKDTNTESFNTNFEMSELQLKESCDILKSETVADSAVSFTDNHEFVHNDDRRLSKTPCEISCELDNFNTTLNVTDYVIQMLNRDDSKTVINKSNEDLNNFGNSSRETIDNLIDLKSNNSQDDVTELTSSQQSCSQDSIVISDEELNYSSIHTKNANCDNYLYNLSESEEILENKETEDDLDVDEIYNVHSALKNKYRNKSISSPVHNRISALKSDSPSAETSLIKECLEDSFNDLLQNSHIVQTLEREASEKLNANTNRPCLENTDDKCTPEKGPNLTVQSVNNATPENNLVIKTKDITPLPNYDEMDTPRVNKELEKFGLKPLKRQRGTVLLKHIYECTHPLVGPREIKELSSDEDDRQRVTKKRKKFRRSNELAVNSVGNDFKCDGYCLEIIGDALFKNENLNELIFERKYSVKVPSCRIPLQIVWHNFLSKNPNIRENVLLYEPLQLEVLHSMIKEQTGCKFHIQDLLTFFDKKCITVRISQGSQKGNRKRRI